MRKLQYMLESKGFQKGLIKRIFYDWAVTLGFHPWALGINSQDQRLLTVPEEAKIICEIVPNVFRSISVQLVMQRIH